jgi:hypothetical protein
MQADAPLASCVSQQAFKHATGIRVAGVIPAHVAPSSKIPIDGAGFGHQVRNGDRLARRPVHVKRALEVAHVLGFVSCAHGAQPGDSVVGPGWLQIGVRNCQFVTRTRIWVHPRPFDFRCMIGLAVKAKPPLAIGREPGPTLPRGFGKREGLDGPPISWTGGSMTTQTLLPPLAARDRADARSGASTVPRGRAQRENSITNLPRNRHEPVCLASDGQTSARDSFLPET